MTDFDWQSAHDRAQQTRTANVVCMKWGSIYGPEWVNRLYGMVARNTSWTIRFVCFTDDASGIRPEVEIRPLPEVRLDGSLGKRWPKVGLMSPRLADLDGMTLYLDLDLVIIDRIDAFFEHPGRFCIIREWQDAAEGYGNSSVMRFFVGAESYVLDRFYSMPHQHWYDTYRSKEQNFVSKSVRELTFWPDEWCVPFSYACLPQNRVLRYLTTPQRPTSGKIVVFFGAVTPATALKGEYAHTKKGRHEPPALLRRRFGPARWIADDWRE